MAGARLSIAPNGWLNEDCAKWLVQGLRIAPNDCEWPQHKKATIKWQFGDRAGQLKTLWHGNCPVTPAKRKIAARQSTDRAGQKKKSRRGNRGITQASSKKLWCGNRGIALVSSKITVWQLEFHAGHFKNRSTAIVVLRQPNKNYGAAIVVLRRPFEKSRHGIALAF